MLIRKLDFEIYADYHQFYLEAENFPLFESEEIWDIEGKATERMLGVGKNRIAVGTARYETVPVSLEFHDSAPMLELEKYSRINECSLVVNSEKLVLAGCTEYLPDAVRIEVEPATYRVRLLYGNLETVIDDWEGEDFYVLQLWKDNEFRDVQIIKQ